MLFNIKEGVYIKYEGQKGIIFKEDTIIGFIFEGVCVVDNYILVAGQTNIDFPYVTGGLSYDQIQGNHSIKAILKRRMRAEFIYKKCSGCKQYKEEHIKEHINFSTRRVQKCRTCSSKVKTKEELLQTKKEYRLKNKKHLQEKERERRKLKKEHIKKVKNEWYKKRRSEPLYRFKHNISSLLYRSIIGKGYSKNSRSETILGCSYLDLINYLNSNPYGFKVGDNNLDVDHIIPVSKATTQEHIVKLNHYSNLQLLPSEYNRTIKKDNPFNKQHFEKWLLEKV